MSIQGLNSEIDVHPGFEKKIDVHPGFENCFDAKSMYQMPSGTLTLGAYQFVVLRPILNIDFGIQPSK